MVVPMTFYLKHCSECVEETEVAYIGNGEYLCNVCYLYRSCVSPTTRCEAHCGNCGKYRTCIRPRIRGRFLCRACSAALLQHDPWKFYY